MPDSDSNLPATREINGEIESSQQAELFKRFLDVEEKRVEVDKLREQNVAKELDGSFQSSKDACNLAEKDLDTKKTIFIEEIELKKNIAGKVFAIIIITVLALVGLVVFLAFLNPEKLGLLMQYVYDIIKIAIGGAFGYLLRAAKKDRSSKADSSKP